MLSTEGTVCRCLKDYDLVFLTGAPWHDYRYHKQIWCQRATADLRRVLYFENVPTRTPRIGDLLRAIKRTRPQATSAAPTDGVRVVTDLLLPEPNRLAGLINEVRLGRTIRRLGIEPGRTLLITNAPGANVLHFIKLAQPALVIYDCDHNYADCPWVPRSAIEQERELACRADCVVCDSRYLYTKWAAQHPRVVQLPPAVDEERIALRPHAAATAARTVAYFGTLRNDIDIALLNQLATRYRVVVIGGISQDLTTPLAPAVVVTGRVSVDTMWNHLTKADAVVLPYVINSYTKAVLPAKVFEALATGLPIVATPLPELEPYREHFYIGSTATEFIAILDSLPARETPQRAGARLEVARANTWERRYAVLRSLLRGDIAAYEGNTKLSGVA